MENEIQKKYKLIKDIPYYNKGLISKYDILSDMHYFQNTKIEDSFSKSFRTWKFFEHEADYLLEMGWIEEVISAKDKLLKHANSKGCSTIYDYMCQYLSRDRKYFLLHVDNIDGLSTFLCVEEIDGDFIGWYWYADLILTGEDNDRSKENKNVELSVIYVEECEETIKTYRDKISY